MPPGTVLGQRQKKWFKASIKGSDACWKLWANAFGTLSRRADFQNLPPKWSDYWPSAGFAVYGTDDWIGYPKERSEILQFLIEEKLPNLVSLSGDRHNFTSGVLFQDENDTSSAPVAVEFGVSSITTPTSFEAFDYVITRIDALRSLYVSGENIPVLNMLHNFGVKSCLDYHKNGDMEAALRQRNHQLGHYLKFIDTSSHGYSLASVRKNTLQVRLVGFKPPVTESNDVAGPEPVYTILFEVESWDTTGTPEIRLKHTTGQLPFPYSEMDLGLI
jgi:alkaline phosphatase D